MVLQVFRRRFIISPLSRNSFHLTINTPHNESPISDIPFPSLPSGLLYTLGQEMAQKRKRDKDNDEKGEGSSAQAKSMLLAFFPFPPLPRSFDNSLTLQQQEARLLSFFFPLQVYSFLP